MSLHEIIRAWKDEDYRNSLSEAQRAQLPAHPAGLIELADDELDFVAGAGQERTYPLPNVTTIGCCFRES